LLVGVNAADEKLEKKLEALQGKWLLERLETKDGKQDTRPNGNDMVLEIKGTKFLTDDTEKAEILALHDDLDPKGIDVKRVDGSDKDEGIYKLEGDKLTIVINVSAAKSRPANFDAPTAEGVILLEFSRKK
jgi:uncharacterized protein (TIGR03067 family)